MRKLFTYLLRGVTLAVAVLSVIYSRRIRAKSPPVVNTALFGHATKPIVLRSAGGPGCRSGTPRGPEHGQQYDARRRSADGRRRLMITLPYGPNTELG